MNKFLLANKNVKVHLSGRELETRNTKLNVHNWLIICAYTAAIGFTEYVLNYFSLPLGLVLYFTIFISLILVSTLERNQAQSDLWLSLGLVPLLRIISTTISTMQFATIIWYILIGFPMFIAIYIMTRHLKYSFNSVGLNNQQFSWQIFIAITGVGLGALDYLILKPKPLVEGSLIKLVLSGLVLLIFSGFMEELIFRGVMQRAASVLGKLGWIIIVLIYSLLQIGHGSPLHVGFTFAVALFFGFVVFKTKSILGVCFAHGLLNVMLFLVMAKIV